MKRLLLSIVPGMIVAGCVQNSPFYRGYSSPDIKDDITSPYSVIMNSITQPTVENNYKVIISRGCANAGSAISFPDKCKAERDQAIYVLMTGSEQVCLIHRRSIYGRDASFNITAGTLTSLFAGISTVVTPTVSKSIFSALAFFANSERSLVNETVYKQMIVTAVDNKIQEIRNNKAQEIVNHLKDDGLETYSLSRAIFDFMDYHSSCSFMEGLRLALVEGTQNSTETKINSLNNRLLLNGVQANIYCGSKKENDVQTCNMLKERNQAITDKLKTLEVQ